MTLGALGLLIPLISFAVALVKWWLNYVSDSSVLRRLQLSLEAQKARMEVEAERLLRAYDRIQAEPDKTGQDLTDSLNEKFKRARRPVAARARRVAVRRLLRLSLPVVLLVLTGCTTVFRGEPALQPPKWPKLTFTLDPATGAQCLDQEEAQRLNKWFDELRAFFSARDRLQKR